MHPINISPGIWKILSSLLYLTHEETGPESEKGISNGHTMGQI